MFSCVAGVYASYFLNGSTGACIVLAQAFVFVLALVWAPKRGMLANSRMRRLAARIGGDEDFPAAPRN